MTAQTMAGSAAATRSRASSSKQGGFTLLEVMIAMSILAVGSISILSIFVAAIRFNSDRIRENRVMKIYDYAYEHAEILFAKHDPTREVKGERARPYPSPVVADLRDFDKASKHKDPLVRRAARRYRGYKYELVFRANPWESGTASATVQIRVWGLQSEDDQHRFSDQVILMRSGTPNYEFYSTPSLQERDQKKNQRGRGR